MAQKVLGVIPARLGSSRIPEKMLKDICGKPLIQWTIERTQKARSLDTLLVATDSSRIKDVVEPLGVEVIMTSPDLPTGTDRVAAAVKQFKRFEPDIIVNIWGDEPLYPAEAIDECVSEIQHDPDLEVCGVADLLEDSSQIAEPSIVKVLTNLNNDALVFSRTPVPHFYNTSYQMPVYHVIGAMAMRRDFLFSFLQLPRTPIELQESVEQMRILEHGYRMRMIKGEYHNLGVNMPDELEKIREIISKKLQKQRQ